MSKGYLKETAADLLWEGGRVNDQHQTVRPVTRRRMREAAELLQGRRIEMRCACGNSFSADAGDYFMHPEDEPLPGCFHCGEPFLMARSVHAGGWHGLCRRAQDEGLTARSVDLFAWHVEMACSSCLTFSRPSPRIVDMTSTVA